MPVNRHMRNYSSIEVGTLLRRGRALLQSGRRNEALRAILEACQSLPNQPELHDEVGSLLTHCEVPGQALKHFEYAVRSAPQNISFRYNLAMAQRMTGDLEAAEKNLDIVVAARPNDGEAYLARADLRTQTLERNHITELECALERYQGERAVIAVEFALAKELEDLGEDARSFAHLAHASDLYRTALRYEVTGDVEVLDALRSSHTADRVLNSTAAGETSSCIFIVGLPRSGTTLVERIVGSHSAVWRAGESNAFPQAVITSVHRARGGPVSKREFVDCSLDVPAEKLGKAYVDLIRPSADAAAHWTDKLPLNYLYLGLIARALPRARLLLLRRHPLDSCYAMFRTLFQAAYPFSYSLSDLAQYYVAWNRLMNHWEVALRDRLLTVQYEELVKDPERVGREILSHCGLPWEAQCLAQPRSSSAFTTASAVQVRQPIHLNSVEKWRRFAMQLQPLMDDLRRAGISCD
jgi:tetratricopeptide (TPR) repeat protein